MKTSIKEQARSLVLLVFLVSFVFLLLCIGQYNLMPALFALLIGVFSVVACVALAIICLYTIKHKGIRQTLKHLQIINSIENSLISIGAYSELINDRVLTPSINIDQKAQEIVINVNDLRIRSRIESNIDIFSSALPDQMIVYKTYLSKDQNTLIIRYKDISKDKRIIFNDEHDFIRWVNEGKPTGFKLDNENTIDLTENNGILITGKSGSGKSFFAQQLLIQGIIKHWDISVLDYKRSYQAFKEFCNVAFTVEDIVKELEAILQDLHHRQEVMDEELKTNPEALAIDKGFPVKFVLIEEYLALVNSGADKKTLDRIEKMILEITTTGRSLNVYLCMVLQVSAATTLNTSIRSNLPIKIVFGNPDRTIYETTFGKSSVPDVMARMDKGEGLVSLDGDIIPFSSPMLACGIKNCLKLLV